MALFGTVYHHENWCRSTYITTHMCAGGVHIHYQYHRSGDRQSYSILGKCDGSCDPRRRQLLPAEVELQVLEFLKKN